MAVTLASSRPAAVSDGLLAPGRRPLTLGLLVTVTLVASESLAVSTIMPLVAADLGGLDLYGWAFSAFFLGSLVGIVVVGGAIDRRGLRLPFAAGLGLFGVGLLIGGLAPSMEVLVLGRALQGLGAGATPPIAYVAIGRSLPEALRPRMFAALSTAWVVPGVIGPSIAGVVGEVFHWRWVFLGLLPLVLLAAFLTLHALGRVPEAPGAAAAGPSSSRAGSRRVPLAVAIAIGAGLALAGLTAAGPLGLGAALLGLVVVLPAYRALTPPGTLRLAAGLPATVLLRGVLTFSFFAADAYVPYLLVEGRGLGAWTGGLAYTAATLTWTGGAWIQARFATRHSTRAFVATAFALTSAGMAITLLVVSTAVPWPLAVVGWSVAGLGMGLGYSPLSLAVLRDAAPEEQGSTTAALQLSDTLGTALGTGTAGAIVAAAERWSSSGATSVDGTTLGLVGAFGLGIAVALLGRLGSRRLSERAVAAAPAAARSVDATPAQMPEGRPARLPAERASHADPAPDDVSAAAPLGGPAAIVSPGALPPGPQA